ncbi:MAG: pentapeptide repeat-containing protein [Alphaproteobacteria bacterium]
MKNYTIYNHQTADVLYEGKYRSFKECLEDSVRKNINMMHADLSGQNLSNVNIDNAQLSNALFRGSNLCQANLSEGDYRSADFTGANLIGACMAESDFSSCNFKAAHFGANILNNTILDRAEFNTLSAYLLPFCDVKSMHECSFFHHENQLFTISKPPVVLLGAHNTPMVLAANTVFYGHQKAVRHIKEFTTPAQNHNLDVHKEVDKVAQKAI